MVDADSRWRGDDESAGWSARLKWIRSPGPRFPEFEGFPGITLEVAQPHSPLPPTIGQMGRLPTAAGVQRAEKQEIPI